MLTVLNDRLRLKLPENIHTRVVNTYACKIEVYLPEYGKEPLRDTDFHNVTCDLTILAPVRHDPSLVVLLHSNYLEFNLSVPTEYSLPVVKDGIVYEGLRYNCPANTELFLTAIYGYLGTDCRFDIQIGKYVKKLVT